jgi:hypothetical protein
MSTVYGGTSQGVVAERIGTASTNVMLIAPWMAEYLEQPRAHLLASFHRHSIDGGHRRLRHRLLWYCRARDNFDGA